MTNHGTFGFESLDFSDEDFIVSDSKSFNNLSNLISDDEDLIVLDSHFQLDDNELRNFKDGIEVNCDDLIIDGRDHIIDAKGKSPIFNVSGNNITFKNIKFINAFVKKSGSIVNNSKGSLTFINCQFINSSSKREGGAIYNLEGNLLFKDCKFKNNSSKRDGGAIYNFEGELTFDECIFFENSSKWYGGVIFNKKGIVKISNSKFIGNYSLREGSDIWNGFYLELTDNEFFSDSDKKNISMIFQENEDSNLKVLNSSFISHNETIIYLNGGNSNLKNSKFCIANADNDNYIIYNENAILEIENSKFNSSYSKVIYNNSSLKIIKDENIENLIESTDKSDVKYFFESLPDVWYGFDYFYKEFVQKGLKKISLDCDIVLHESEQNFYEGGIELNQDDLEIDGNNHIIDGSGLSRIFLITGNNITLKNIIFKNGQYWKNYLDDEYCGGGAIDVLHDCSLNLINCKFIENDSKNSAGAILNNGKLNEFRNCDFIKNTANRYGGALINEKMPMSVFNCEFDENKSDDDGGSIYNINASLTFKECKFKGNVSNNNGGAIYSECADLLMLEENCIFENNQSNEGGAIYVNEGSIDFKDCNFKNNGAIKGDGGVICFRNGIDFIIEKSIFDENSSKNQGGAIFSFYNKESYCINNCKFSNNTASSGGAIYNQLNTFNVRTTIKNSDFNNNNSTSGGAIGSRGYLKLINCNFENNHASYNGGAISNESRLNVSDCNFINNPSKDLIDLNKNEGDIYNGTGGAISFKNCNFKSSYTFIMMNENDINIGEGNNFEKHHSFLRSETGKYSYIDDFDGY